MPKSNLTEKRQNLTKDTKGLSTVEYIIILILIAVAGIGLWTTFGESLEGQITEATGAVDGLGN